MTDVTQLLRTGGAPSSQRQVVAGYVSLNKAAPVDFSGDLFVILPSLATDYSFGPCKWGAAQGSTLPAQGTEVLVCFDDENVPVVVWWEGSPGFAPTGTAGGDLTGSYPNPTIGVGKVGTTKTVADNLQTGTSLGTGSFDGQLAYYAADATNGVIWTFRWRTAASGNKWECVGGSAMTATQSASSTQTTANVTTFAALTNGPSITAPLTGDYDCPIVGNIQQNVAALVQGVVSVAVAGTATGAGAWLAAGTQFESSSVPSVPRISVTQGQAITLRVATNNNSCTFGNLARWQLSLVPVRVT